MGDSQFAGIYLILLLIMFIVEVGMLSACDHLKTIKRILEKMDGERSEKNDL